MQRGVALADIVGIAPDAFQPGVNPPQNATLSASLITRSIHSSAFREFSVQLSSRTRAKQRDAEREARDLHIGRSEVGGWGGVGVGGVLSSGL